MKRRVAWSAALIGCACLIVAAGAYTAALALAATATPAPAPTLVWSDEFNGPAGASPDASKWEMITGLRCLGNNELEYYTPRASNVALDGAGDLAITARSETYGSGVDTRPYTSGWVDTRGLYSTTYGSIQARIKLPAGRGLWPAFWAMPASPVQDGSQYGEIDLMENLGQNPHKVYGSIHSPTVSRTPLKYGLTTSVQSATSPADDFHTYGINWSPTSIQCTLDGLPYATYTPSSLSGDQRWVFDQPFYLILNLAVGGNWPGSPDGTTPFPATMLVDWVRVYSASEAVPVPDPSPTPSPTPTPGDVAGLAFRTKNVTVRHGATCRIPFAIRSSESAPVIVRFAIMTKSGGVKKSWSRRYYNNLNDWRWTKYACRLRRGTYRIAVTGRDLAGNHAAAPVQARLVVR